MVGRPSQRIGSGREDFLEGWEWLGGPPKGLGVAESLPGGPGVVGRQFRMAGVVGRPSRRAVNCR